MIPSNQPNLFTHQLVSQVKEFAKIKSEHDLRLKVKDAFFADYSVDVEDERVDFLVWHERSGFFTETFLWAESKDKPTDIFEMFAQFLLTIKKKIDFGEMPPKYLGVFDKEKITFVEFYNVLDIFNLNDFDWTERPSAASNKTVHQVAKYLKNIVEYRFESDVAEIVGFIRTNFSLGKIGTTKAQINKNNFVTIYNKWVREVLPTIGLNDDDWKDLKKKDVSDCEFYLADLLSEDNKTISDKLNIVLQQTHYETKVRIANKMKFYYDKIVFCDNGDAHAKFWARYERPPKQEYHQHILERRDLLVPQSIRERKGAFFTPQIWVEKSQEYLAQVFGENWQEEYYVWDCCAGTCNLLAGLTNKYNVWASTIDQPDVDIVHELIANNQFNLLDTHVFRFDFLNDGFDDLPEGLQDIINDPEKRKRLVIYMNPPYVEAMNKRDAKKAKSDVNRSQVEKTYQGLIGKSIREIFVQFFIRIAKEIPDCKLASFGKLKYVCSPNFLKFREHFKAAYKDGFVCRAGTFDNVSGPFPIGFLIWDLSDKKTIAKVKTDVLLHDRHVTTCWKEGARIFHAIDEKKSINDWLKQFAEASSEKNPVSMCCIGNDFQHNNYVNIDFKNNLKGVGNAKGIAQFTITPSNFIEACVYFSVRHCMKATWLNDRDQFLWPNDGYLRDKKFQNDCIIFTVLHHQNRLRSRDGVNHVIPFTAREVDAKDNFRSTRLSDFLKNRELSKEAQNVFEAGKSLWKYYHKIGKSDKKAPIDASLYEIREYFKGRDQETGRMKTKQPTNSSMNLTPNYGLR